MFFLFLWFLYFVEYVFLVFVVFVFYRKYFYILCFILYQVKREDVKLKKILLISEKYYVADPGFYFLFNDESQRDWGKLLENVVFIELIRRGYSVNVGKVNDFEIDFVCYKANKKKYIQVSESVKDPNTRKREFKPLTLLKDNYPALSNMLWVNIY